MLVEENKALGSFTTFGIGGPARWFVEAMTEDDVAEAAAWARERKLPLFVLGGGSNLLVSDAGFDGIVMRIALRGIVVDCAKEEAMERTYRVGAGEDWDGFVQRTVQENCAGIECLAGIPGTVGGTPVQNVGAYGQEVASVVDRVRAFDLQQHSCIEFSAGECDFCYRKSRFNSVDAGRFVVTRVDYRLIPGGEPTVRYADLQRALAEKQTESRPSLEEVASAVRGVRQAKGMLLVEGDPDCRSAGSFFKKPDVSEDQLRRVATVSEKDPPRFPAGPAQVKLPAAWLIEQAGFHKGYTLGAAAVSSRHTLALINRGGATAREILALATEILNAVKVRFGIELEMEPVRVGF